MNNQGENQGGLPPKRLDREQLRNLVRLARPQQYVKNLFIFGAPFFGDKLGDLQTMLRCVLAFAAFSLLASAVYVFNDLRDKDWDRQHPEKRQRPVASGAVPPRRAWVFAACLLGASCLAWPFLHGASLLLLCGYLLLNVLYSLQLKHVAVIDVAVLSLGFVLRALMGAVEAQVAPSPWLVVMTFLLAMFLALAKRRDDLLLLQTGNAPRKCLDGYNIEFVSMAMVLMAGVVIVSYVLFTVSPEVTERYGTQYLYLTAFWVILGILRFLQISIVHEQSGSPTQVVLTDIFLQLVLLAWLANYLLIIYVF